jgi:hypothetical protein
MNREDILRYVYDKIAPHHHDELCPDTNNTLFSVLKLDRIFGTPSVNGEAWKVFFRDRNHNVQLALKKIPLYDYDLQYVRNLRCATFLSSEPLIELKVMELCHYLLDQEICPNLPYHLKYVFCQDCKFQNNALSMRFIANLKPETCIMMVNEFANSGDLKNWLQTPHSIDEFLSLFFQIYVALYALQHHFDITHHDLHTGNVLVHKVTREVLSYTINGTIFNIDNHGWLFVLWDFGYARCPNKLEAKKYHEYDGYYTSKSVMLSPSDRDNPIYNNIPRLTCDYFRITHSVNQSLGAGIARPPELVHFYNAVKKYWKVDMTLKYLIPVVFQQFIKRTNGSGVVKKYFVTRQVSLLPCHESFRRVGDNVQESYNRFKNSENENNNDNFPVMFTFNP